MKHVSMMLPPPYFAGAIVSQKCLRTCTLLVVCLPHRGTVVKHFLAFLALLGKKQRTMLDPIDKYLWREE